jgi:NTE family protein
LHRSGLASIVIGPAAQLVSPYQINPFDFNPLRELLERLVDFERLRVERSPKLLIAATTLRTGSLRLFTNRDLSAKAVLASACLPWLHQAVEIDGEPHWDGGYVSNPPLVPLIERCPAPNVLLVRINPKRRHSLPTSAGDIRNRIGEIVFDQPLARELAELDARRRTLLGFTAATRRIARHRLHVIDGGDQLAELDPGSKMIPVLDTLTEIRALGRQAASTWLDIGTDARRSEPEPGAMEAAA